MKFTVYNHKGGQGKSIISYNLALTMDFGIITNDPYSPIEDLFEEDRFIKLKPKDSLPEVPKEFDVIFDLGGFLDKRITKALKQSKCVVVPVINEYQDVQTTLTVLQGIEEYNKKIIIVVNKAQKNDFDELKSVMKKLYPKYPVFELKYSRSLPNTYKEHRSIKEVVAGGGLKSYMYKPVAEQFDKIIKAINSK